MNKIRHTFRAFTMIELLVVLGVIGILAGIFMSTINARRQQEIAVDTQRRQKLKETADLIEGFRVAEGYYPDEGSNNDPLDSTADDKDILENYLSEWYTGLKYNVSADENNFSIHIESTVFNNVFFKYSSIWNYVNECTDLAGDMNDPAVCNIVI